MKESAVKIGSEILMFRWRGVGRVGGAHERHARWGLVGASVHQLYRFRHLLTKP
jgi:hypothetical protein